MSSDLKKNEITAIINLEKGQESKPHPSRVSELAVRQLLLVLAKASRSCLSLPGRGKKPGWIGFFLNLTV